MKILYKVICFVLSRSIQKKCPFSPLKLVQNLDNMKINIYPYQWELLGSMICYRVTNGLCLDYKRLGKKDFETINESVRTISVLSLQKWFSGRKVAVNALNDLCRYASSLFPYNNWKEFQENEINIELIGRCQDWDMYSKSLKAKPNTKPFKALAEIKQWAYKRTIELSNGQGMFYRIQDEKLFVEDKKIKEYDGEYNFFMPGQIPPINYNSVYRNKFKMNNGVVSFQNVFIKKEFTGHTTIKDSTLQILLHEKEDGINHGVEYVVFVRINKYGSSAIYFPGIVLGYDGQGNICSYPVLITTDLSLTIKSPLVNLFLEHCYDEIKSNSYKGRIECINPSIINSLCFSADLKNN